MYKLCALDHIDHGNLQLIISKKFLLHRKLLQQALLLDGSRDLIILCSG
jgi:hypothetical protein